MIRNHVPPTPGTYAAFCGVPEHDYERGIYHPILVERVDDDGTVWHDGGARCGVASAWPSLTAIADAIDMHDALVAIDEQMMRNAF